MKARIILQSVLALGLIAGLSTANAQVSKGKAELGFSGSYSSIDASMEGEGSASIDLTMISLSGGYFVMDPLEISGSIGYMNADIEGFGLSAFMIGGAADYHFNIQGKLVPYAGAGLGWITADADEILNESEDTWYWEIHAGLKQFIKENVVIKYQISYFDFSEIETVDIDGFSISAGISYFFK